MGGGTPLVEANRVGCHVVGADVNPMAYWIVRQELAGLDRQAFQSAAQRVIQAVEATIGNLYETTCVYCGNHQASVKYFLWVKRQLCTECRRSIDLFTKYLVAKNQRHPNYVLVCSTCGAMNEVEQLDHTPASPRCTSCQARLTADGPARRSRCACPHCGHENSYPNSVSQPLTHRLFAIEYHCPICKPTHQGRFFKAPDERDLSRVKEAKKRLQNSHQNYIPDDLIPPGDETDRLHRWGYQTYRQLFNDRQLLGLQALAAEIAAVDDESVRHALLTVFSDTLRYQNMICRYDSYSLKIIDVFSVHGFPVSTIQCENSLLGIPGVGSGGFRHFVKKFDQAKAYCEKPFETYPGRPKRTVSLPNETIGAKLVSNFPDGEAPKSAYLVAVSADELALPASSLDAVLTDPPYFANVQYAELMDFCYVWLRKHLAGSILAFRPASTRSEEELTVNETEGRGIAHFTAGLSGIFRNFTRALKPGAPFAFTYHHNDFKAYLPIAVALLDAGLVCTTTLPCPAEMSASIHISGTQSSVVDTIFVCRTTGTVQSGRFEATPQNLKRLIKADLEDLQEAGHDPTQGDARCLILGHMVRLVVWQLRSSWRDDIPFSDKLSRVEAGLQQVHPLDFLDRLAAEVVSSISEVDLLAAMRVEEKRTRYDATDQVSF